MHRLAETTAMRELTAERCSIPAELNGRLRSSFSANPSLRSTSAHIHVVICRHKKIDRGSFKGESPVAFWLSSPFTSVSSANPNSSHFWPLSVDFKSADHRQANRHYLSHLLHFKSLTKAQIRKSETTPSFRDATRQFPPQQASGNVSANGMCAKIFAEI